MGLTFYILFQTIFLLFRNSRYLFLKQFYLPVDIPCNETFYYTSATFNSKSHKFRWRTHNNILFQLKIQTLTSTLNLRFYFLNYRSPNSYQLESYFPAGTFRYPLTILICRNELHPKSYILLRFRQGSNP